MRIPGLAVKIDEAALPWRATRHPGIEWVPLFLAEGDPEARGGTRAEESTVLIRMAPGCGYPAHRHVGVEEVLVLRGGYRDEQGEHRAGAYLRYPPGSVHTPVALGVRGAPAGPTNEACLLFASARGGVENLPRG
ncbi:MAG: cupin domain-containing protein [Planctomycetota bacterium]|nr:cupin domain-containing protein [Planctomycetota bacterium]